jgi:ABC-type glycerol-3-phosphate transport system substrate-binding protein
MEGYTEEFEGPPGPQVSEGVGISINCKDPVGAVKYLDFLTSEEAVKARDNAVDLISFCLFYEKYIITLII